MADPLRSTLLELLLERRRAGPAPARIRLEVDHRDPGYRLEQPSRGPALARAGLGRVVVVERHGGLDPLREREEPAIETVGEELRGVALRERQVRLQHLVVELDGPELPGLETLPGIGPHRARLVKTLLDHFGLPTALRAYVESTAGKAATASSAARPTLMPFTVGGGVRSLDEVEALDCERGFGVAGQPLRYTP